MPKYDWLSKKCDSPDCHQDHLFLTDTETGRIYASIHGPGEFGHFAMFPNDDESSEPVKYVNSDLALAGALQHAERVSVPKPTHQEQLNQFMEVYMRRFGVLIQPQSSAKDAVSSEPAHDESKL